MGKTKPKVLKGTPISKWKPEQLSKLNIKIVEKGATQALNIPGYTSTRQDSVRIEISRMLKLLPTISVADSEATIRRKLADASHRHQIPELCEFAAFLCLLSKVRSRNDNYTGAKYTRGNPDPNVKKDEDVGLSAGEDVGLSADDDVGLSADDDVGLSADDDVGLSADDDVGLSADDDVGLSADDDVGLSADKDAEMNGDEDTEMSEDEDAEMDGDEDAEMSEGDGDDTESDESSDTDKSESVDEYEDDMDTDEDDMSSTQESIGSSHSATDKHELKLRDTPENISGAVLHEFLSTVTTLYYRKLDRTLGQHLEWTRQEMNLRLDIAGKRHDGKADGALLLFESKGGNWMKSDGKVWIIVENKKVSTGGLMADTQRCGEMLATIQARRAENGEPLKGLESQLYLVGLDGEEFVCMSATFSEKYLSGEDTTVKATVYKLKGMALSSGLRIGTPRGREMIWRIVFDLVHGLSEELCADLLRQEDQRG